MLKVIALVWCTLISAVVAYAGVDKGHFDDSRFKTSVRVDEPRVVGNGTYKILTNGQVSTKYVEQLFEEEAVAMRQFLEEKGYVVMPQKFMNHTISIKVISISDLNDPRYFEGTEEKCKAGIYADPKKCSGFFMGRTIYLDGVLYSPITVYVGYASGKDYVNEYSVRNTLQHELFHALIARFDLKYRMSDRVEHSLLEEFITYMSSREKNLGEYIRFR